MVFSKFDSLSARPPTPPKELHDHVPNASEAVDQFLEDPFGDLPVLPKVVAATKALLNTPVQSPSSDISIPSSSASRQKRVNFQLQTCTIPLKKALAPDWTPTRSSPLRPLPQTRVSKPLKSILKPSDGTATPPIADEGAAAHKFKSFAEMLESIVKLLASPDRSSRMDAYHSLQRTMQAYDKIPDDQALKRKMSLLTQFIRRDVQAPNPIGEGLDTPLIKLSLQLLMALFRIHEAAAAMDDDFCAFIVDRSIQVAADSAMPKIVINTHLAVLMQQNFRLKIMNNMRVEKILEALDNIHKRVGGYSVQAYRIRIHRKLIQQRPDIMTKHTERWFKLTIDALKAGQKDIHQSALDIAISAAKTIGYQRRVAKSCLAVLNHVNDDGRTLTTEFTQRLERMLSGNDACLVPQFWSAVTILLRDLLHNSIFPGLKEWLQIFEKCIKSKKDAVRVQANVAFGFLVYSVNLSQDTPDLWSSMLASIPHAQLKQQVPSKKEERNAVSSGYLTLLFYAFRPTASHEQFDRYWREFVSGFWKDLLLLPDSLHATAACRIVSALLNGSRKPWNEQRALDQRHQCMIKGGELPLLDPRWVRRSLSTVLQFVDTLLEATPWPDKEQNEDEPVISMWLAVLGSLVEASSKEIMASTETKDAMAHIVNLLRRVWDTHTAQLALSQQTEDSWANKFCFLLETVVGKLGALHFTDKFLTRNESDDFEVASTPSHRSKKHGARISPLLYFVDLLVNQSEGKLPDAVRLRALNLILEPCFNAQNTRLGQLELLRDCSSIVDTSLKSTVASKYWKSIAELLHVSLQAQQSDTTAQGSRSLGKDYDVVVEILGSGSSYFTTTDNGYKVLLLFIETVKKEAGEAAVVLAVVEKVSEQVSRVTASESTTSCLPYVTLLLRHLPKQTSRRSLEQCRQNLWPSSAIMGRTADFDPYNHLYGAVVAVGTLAYEHLSNDTAKATEAFLAALATSILNCPMSHLVVYLRKTQEVVRKWVEDSDRKLQSTAQPFKALHSKVVFLWTEVTKAIERLPRKDGHILIHLESLITAGFVSRRRSIVNISITTWNKTFGQEESLQYPSSLEHALRRLRTTVELSLPSLDVRDDDATDTMSFYDSEDGNEHTRQTFKSPTVKESPFRVSKSARKSSTRSPAVPTPSNRRATARQTPKVRLRHDDSQVKFEPIVSSPSNPFNQESQVLTERQKEMIEHQRLSGSLFSNIGAPSPQPDAVSSPMELHSDVPTADDLPMTAARTTPRQALAAMGPMDAFLGSSPTPHARKSTRQIPGEDSTLSTPTAVRRIKVMDNDDLGSSPPQFGKSSKSNAEQLDSDVLVGSSFEYRQLDTAYDESFDDGTTIDEDAMLDAVARFGQAEDPSEIEPSSDVVMSELPSSTIDLQLTAQLDADIQAHTAAASQDAEEPAAESNNEFVDAASHPQNSNTEVNASQPLSPAALDHEDNDVDTSSMSRVGDSFSKPSSSKGTPKSQSVRRSNRHSATPSPLMALGKKKRKSTPAKADKQAKQAEMEEPEEQTPTKPAPAPETDEGDMLDNIVVVPRSGPLAATKKRKSTSDELPHKRGPYRRSQSQLSQVENSQDILVEDTPTPKRARQSTSQDVSDAKAKRLSHVQVTPKRSAESRRSSSLITSTPAVTPAPAPAETPAVAATPSRSFTERVILTPRSIINQLRSLKDYIFSGPKLVLRGEEQREIDTIMFDIKARVLYAEPGEEEE